MQCRLCGAGVGGNISMAGVVEMWDEKLEQLGIQSYRAACDEWTDRRRAAYEAAVQQKSRIWWSAYEKYLQSAVWAKKREMVHQRNAKLNNGLCEACGERPASEVHHTSYPETFGHEPLWVLRAVCRRCHEIFHPHMREG